MAFYFQVGSLAGVLSPLFSQVCIRLGAMFVFFVLTACNSENQDTEKGIIEKISNSQYSLTVLKNQKVESTLDLKLVERFNNPDGTKVPKSLRRYWSFSTTCGNLKFFQTQSSKKIICGNCEEHGYIFVNCPVDLKNVNKLEWLISDE